jgi:molybdate transport system substrate-binding protein
MKEAFDGGAPCDVIVLTAAMIDAMAAAGRVLPDTRAALGRVRTGIAVREHDATPEVGNREALRAALLAADAVYFPDPERATAGIHFAKVLRELGIADTLRERLRTFPNGAAAMRELAAATSARPIGCTQHTEILYTPGLRLVAPLPREFELATVYTAAVAAGRANDAMARRFVQRLAGPDAQALRTAGGFET